MHDAETPAIITITSMPLQFKPFCQAVLKSGLIQYRGRANSCRSRPHSSLEMDSSQTVGEQHKSCEGA